MRKVLLSNSNSNSVYHVKSPANIALVKYWGKKGRQLPCNPSISFTLKNSYTDLILEVVSDSTFSIELFFEEKRNPAFEKKISNKLQSMFDLLPWLENKKLIIKSTNTFPHSAGIASSAASMSALAWALASFEREQLAIEKSEQEISAYARILSGSACRSLGGPVMLWGKVNEELGSDEYAVKVEEVHEIFNQFEDAILIIDDQPKEVSSTIGHGLMNGHPYRESRYDLARDHTKLMLKALKEGDLNLFGNILEQEALGLHALMMSSDPSFILMKPRTLEIILLLRKYREENDLDCYFTLDAGANLHLLYPAKDKKAVQEFIGKCEIDNILFDTLGPGVQNVD